MTAAPLSICMVTDDFAPAATGVGVHVQTLSRVLARSGHRVSVITSRQGKQAGIEDWHGVRVYRTASLSVFGFRQALATRAFIRRVLSEEAVDIVHCHYLSLLLIQTCHAAGGGGCRLLYTYHMPVSLLSQPPPLRVFAGLFFRVHVKYCNRFDQIIAPSGALSSEISSFGIRTPIRIVNNPVDISEMGQVSASRDSQRAANRPLTILFVGRMGPEKNLPLLLNAVAVLIRRQIRAELWLVGDGILLPRLRALANELGISGSVIFHGLIGRDRLATFYSAADVFVLPSVVEVQPLVAIEAMRFGLPLILTDRIAAARELVADGVSGYVVSADNPDELADRLQTVAASDSLREVMGAAGRERSHVYEPEHAVAELEDIYRGLLT